MQNDNIPRVRWRSGEIKRLIVMKLLPDGVNPSDRTERAYVTEKIVLPAHCFTRSLELKERFAPAGIQLRDLL